MEQKDISYIAFESEMARAEMRDKRKDRIIALLAIIIFISNLAWLCFFNQFDFAGDTTTQETQGDANYIGNDGDITNGVPSD